MVAKSINSNFFGKIFCGIKSVYADTIFLLGGFYIIAFNRDLKRFTIEIKTEHGSRPLMGTEATNDMITVAPDSSSSPCKVTSTPFLYSRTRYVILPSRGDPFKWVEGTTVFVCPLADLIIIENGQEFFFSPKGGFCLCKQHTLRAKKGEDYWKLSRRRFSTPLIAVFEV